MQWRASLALLWMGCTSDDPPKADDGSGDSPPTDTQTVTTRDPGYPAELTSSGVVTCPAPDTRDLGRFQLRNGPEMPLSGAQLIGGGIVAADFTGDDLADIFLPSESDRQFFVQQPDGLFEDVAGDALGPIDLTNGVGGSAADADGDGDLDLLVTRFDRPVKLLRNDGTGHFEDVTAASGLGVKSEKWQSSSWGDFDGDGDLDLVIGAYGATPENAFDTEQAPGDPKAFYLNNGDGTFIDRSDLLPASVHEAYTFMTAWYDLNGDNLPELFFINDFAAYRHSVVLWNRGGTSFEIAEGIGFANSIFGMGFAVGDINGDQLPDGLVTSWKDIELPLSTVTTDLYGNPSLLYVDGAAARNVFFTSPPQSYGWGTDFADLDNDADLDLLVGYGWWSTYPSNPEDQPDNLFLNDGTGTFVDATFDPLWDLDDTSATRGILTLDLDRNGWVDVLKRDLTGPTLLRLANCGTESWATVSLRAPGPNTRAVGARLLATVGEVVQTRWIESGSRSLYVGGPPEAHFGLGAAETLDTLEIQWPDGEVSRFYDVPARQNLTVTR